MKRAIPRRLRRELMREAWAKAQGRGVLPAGNRRCLGECFEAAVAGGTAFVSLQFNTMCGASTLGVCRKLPASELAEDGGF